MCAKQRQMCLVKIFKNTYLTFLLNKLPKRIFYKSLEIKHLPERFFDLKKQYSQIQSQIWSSIILVSFKYRISI
jgi:hypothetical protein